MIKKITTFFSLFGSLSTLLCCALPVTLVSIGMGASFASLTSTFPQLIFLIERKNLLFAFTGLLLALSFYLMKRAEKLSCPIDSDQRELCQSSRPVSKYILIFSLLLYFLGLIFSFILPLFL